MRLGGGAGPVETGRAPVAFLGRAGRGGLAGLERARRPLELALGRAAGVGRLEPGARLPPRARGERAAGRARRDPGGRGAQPAFSQPAFSQAALGQRAFAQVVLFKALQPAGRAAVLQARALAASDVLLRPRPLVRAGLPAALFAPHFPAVLAQLVPVEIADPPAVRVDPVDVDGHVAVDVDVPAGIEVRVVPVDVGRPVAPVAVPVVVVVEDLVDEQRRPEGDRAHRQPVDRVVVLHHNRGGGGGGRRDEGLRRVVDRHVDLFGIGRGDADRPVVDLDHLGRVGLEVAGGGGLRPHPLRRVEQAVGLGDHRVAQPLGPVEIGRHHPQHRREAAGEDLHARIPGLGLGGLGAVLVRHALRAVEKAVGLGHVERIGRGDEDLGQQRVGIERDRGDQRVEIRRRLRRRPRRRRFGGAGPGGGRLLSRRALFQSLLSQRARRPGGENRGEGAAPEPGPMHSHPPPAAGGAGVRPRGDSPAAAIFLRLRLRRRFAKRFVRPGASPRRVSSGARAQAPAGEAGWPQPRAAPKDVTVYDMRPRSGIGPPVA